MGQEGRSRGRNSRDEQGRKTKEVPLAVPEGTATGDIQPAPGQAVQRTVGTEDRVDSLIHNPQDVLRCTSSGSDP